MSTNFYEIIIDNYKKLYNNKEGYDTKIYVGEKPNIKEFHVHSFILKTQSEFFKTAFTEDKKRDGYFVLNSSNSPKLFEILLSYMYCGNVDLTKLQSHEILSLLLPLDEFKVQPLVTYTQETLIKSHCDFITKNIVEIIELIYQRKSFNELWDLGLQQICDNPDRLFESTKFLTFNPSILEIILKRDNFCIAEITIWENLLKWTCGQHPAIQKDINKWSKNDFTVMERRISRFISLVRFYHISSEDFLLKVYPFKELLPNNLINNILAYHMVPNNKLNVDIPPYRQSSSVIITSRHLATFASWIEKKNDSYYNNIRNIPSSFKLLYRASRDGDTIAAFSAKCDNKGPTIVIAKVANSEQIVGGYNPLQWKPNSNYQSTNDSFIFSFTNRNDFQSAKVGYPTNIQYSIYYNTNMIEPYGHGVAFGLDLIRRIDGTWISDNPYSYSEIDIPQRNFDHGDVSITVEFNVDDYEVFQVVKR